MRNSPHSNFQSSRGESLYLAAYDAALGLWGIPTTSRYVPTRWGRTHVLACGPTGAPPLVLLHGMSLSATMWYANACAWSRSRRLYAVDTIGSAGKSVATRPIGSRADFAGWMGDLLDGLGLFRSQIKVLPTVYADQELRRVDHPTLLLIGAQEVIYDPQAAVDRAQRLMPHLAAELIPDANHDLPMKQPEVINARVLAFLEPGAPA